MIVKYKVFRFLYLENKYTDVELYYKMAEQLKLQDLECSYCGNSGCFKVHGRYSRYIVEWVKDSKVCSSIKMIRFRCENCKKTHTFLPAFIIPYFSYGLHFIMLVLMRYFQKQMTVLQICKKYDISLLNEAREKPETIICRFCKSYGLPLPRRYRKCAGKDYPAFAKSKKYSAKKIRKALRKQLGYVARDIGYPEKFMSDGYAMTDKEISLYLTIITLYEQQKYMYDNKVHSVEHRIVSISQPWLRPIVRGKVKAPVEFGAKFDLSLDGEGYGRSEKISPEAYNESACLTEAVERFMERTGYYPERVPADQIYRTGENRNYCKDHGIRLSGPKLGRPSANAKIDKKQEYQDNTDRIEVERTFSLSKRCYGMNCITTKPEETQLTSIALSVFVTNLFKIQKRILFALFRLYRIWDRYGERDLQMSA